MPGATPPEAPAAPGAKAVALERHEGLVTVPLFGNGEGAEALAFGPDPPATAAFAPPLAVRLFKYGDNPTTKRLFRLDAGARKCMEAAQNYGNEYPFDFCHAMFQPRPGVPPDENDKAAGWFKLEARGDGLYAAVTHWSKRALALMQDKEFRFTSPTFLATEDGEVVEILNCALTNTPATCHLPPLVAHQHDNADGAPAPPAPEPASPAPEDAPMKGVIAMLGLGAEASEGEAVAALTKINSQLEAARAEGARVFEALGAKSAAEALGKVEGLKQAAAEGEKAKGDLAAALERDAARVEGEKRARVKALLDKGEGDGKLTPASRAKLAEQADSLGPEFVEAFLSVKGREVPDAAAEPARSAASPASAPAGASPAALSLPPGCKRWEDYSGRELDALARANRATFDAVKNEYLARTKGGR